MQKSLPALKVNAIRFGGNFSSGFISSVVVGIRELRENLSVSYCFSASLIRHQVQVQSLLIAQSLAYVVSKSRCVSVPQFVTSKSVCLVTSSSRLLAVVTLYFTMTQLLSFCCCAARPSSCMSGSALGTESSLHMAGLGMGGKVHMVVEWGCCCCRPE